jgi:hypothetical protein
MRRRLDDRLRAAELILRVVGCLEDATADEVAFGDPERRAELEARLRPLIG